MKTNLYINEIPSFNKVSLTLSQTHSLYSRSATEHKQPLSSNRDGNAKDNVD